MSSCPSRSRVVGSPVAASLWLMAARAEADAPAEAARPAPLATEGRSGPADAIGDALTRSGRFGWGAGIEMLNLKLTEA